MLLLGIILLIIGLLVGIPVLFWIGLILAIIGLVVNFVPMGGTTRRWY